MSDQMAQLLRKTIDKSSLTLSELARLTGTKQPNLWDFMHGGRIRSDTMQKLADHFGLVLARKPKRPRK